MDLVKYFNNKELSINLTTLLIDNEPYFIAKEVATILGYDDTTQAIRKNVDELDQKMLSYTECKDLFGDIIEEDKDIEQAEDVQVDGNLSPVSWTGLKSTIKINPFGMKLINEAGLYTLVIKSDKPEAKPFRRWVTSEVLPSIRKTGSYGVQPATPQTYLEALKALVASEEEKEQLRLTNETLTQERDHAIKTKSQINDKRTASLMGKTGALTKENTKLKNKLQDTEEKLETANTKIETLEAEREIACLGLYHKKEAAKMIKDKYSFIAYADKTLVSKVDSALKAIALAFGEKPTSKPNPKDSSYPPMLYYSQRIVDQLFECIEQNKDYLKSFK